jgi:colanic acid biosynthesis glycosyl transferase WcaI
MKILAIHRYFDRDTAFDARMLRAILEQQAASGRDVTVFSVQPDCSDASPSSQPKCETAGEVFVRRIRLLPERSGRRMVRAINTAWFLLRCLVHATMASRYDLVIASNHPPALMGWVLRTIRALRGTPYIYYCPELHPETSIIGGDLKLGRWYDRLLRWDTATCLAARRVVVPSNDMAETLAARGVPTERIAVISNFPIPTNSVTQPELPPPLNDPSDTVRLLFTGNLDRLHGLERLIAAARLVAGRVPFQLVFMGDGSAKSELVELAGDLVGRRIVFTPPQSIETTVAAMRVCDYTIASLAADAHYSTYPAECNLHGWAGCPVIAIVEPHSELAQSIERHDLGYVATSCSVAGIAETLLNAVAERRQWTPQRRSQLEKCCRVMSSQVEMQRAWDEIITGTSPQKFAMPQPGRASKAA